MKNVFWLEGGRLGGRPGPNRIPWNLEEFRSDGVTLVLSLTERMIGESSQFAAMGIAHACLPLPKAAPPRPGDAMDIELALPGIYEVVRRHLDADRAHRVVVHCSSGKDRSGLFLAYYLMRRDGLTAEEALRQVRAIVPRLLTAEGWARMGDEVLTKLEADGSQAP